MKGRSSSNERQKFGASLPDNRSQTAADLTSFNSRPFSPPPSSIIIESSRKNEDGEASGRGRRRRGGRQRKRRRDGRGIVTESDLVFSRRRIRRGWRSSFWASVDKRRRQSRIVIMRQWSGWLSRQTATIERGFWKQKQKRERDEPTLDERLLRYLLCARALVIMRLASRGSQRIRDDAQRRGPLRYAQSSAFSATAAASPDFLSFRFVTIPHPRPIG